MMIFHISLSTQIYKIFNICVCVCVCVCACLCVLVLMPTEHDLDERGMEMTFTFGWMRSELDQIICQQLWASVAYKFTSAWTLLPTDEPQKDWRCPITDGRNEAQGKQCFHTCLSQSDRTNRFKSNTRRERLERPDSVLMTGDVFDCFVTITGSKEGN